MEQTQPERLGPARGGAGQSGAFRFPMPLMCTPFKPGTVKSKSVCKFATAAGRG